MPKTKEQKQAILNSLKDKLQRSKSTALVKFNALKVKEMEELRKELKQEGSEYMVAKKTLLGIALREGGAGEFDFKSVEGQIGVAFGYQDEVAAAKILEKFIKNHSEQVDFIGGVLEGKVINREAIIQLAQVPSKPELYAKLVGSLNAPISGFVNVLAGNLRNLIYVLKAIEEKKQTA
ncbi:50S ribosomal protein L10 [Candidatus Parcubacteria bacterium]|nr:MAG: 50S ribosomal protein L10 [Candidatus Parcubacteria bacterium]